MSQLQEDFTHVWNMVSAQGRVSARNGVCTYRGEDGDCCAIGHLLTTNEAERLGEKTVRIAYGEGIMPARLCENYEFYAKLQRAHDEAGLHEEFFVADFQAEMRKVAREYGLTIPAQRTEAQHIEEAACALGDELAAQSRAA